MSLKPEREEKLRAQLAEVQNNLGFLEALANSSPQAFREMYRTVESEHIGYWGAEKALEIVRGKWNYSILMRLIKNGTMRYSELKHELEADGITDYMLSRALKSLIEDKMVTKRVYAEVPVRTEYSPAPRAYQYWRIILELSRWYNTNARDDLLEELEGLSESEETDEMHRGGL